MKWFDFKQFPPPHGMHILVVNYKDEASILRWDARKYHKNDSDDIEFHYDTGCIGRQMYKIVAWMPVSYLDFPKLDEDDNVKLRSNYLGGMGGDKQNQEVLGKIRKQSEAILKMSDEDLEKWVPTGPGGTGVQKYYLTSEIAKLYDELRLGPPVKYIPPVQESFPKELLSVPTPKMITSFGKMRSQIPKADTFITLKRYDHPNRKEYFSDFVHHLQYLLKEAVNNALLAPQSTEFFTEEQRTEIVRLRHEIAGLSVFDKDN